MHLFDTFGYRFQRFSDVGCHIETYTDVGAPKVKMQIPFGGDSGVFFADHRSKMGQLPRKRLGQLQQIPGIVADTHYAAGAVVGKAYVGTMVQIDNKGAYPLKCFLDPHVSSKIPNRKNGVVAMIIQYILRLLFHVDIVLRVEIRA